MVDAFGAICWWGFSPAMDLLEHLDNGSQCVAEELNFLIVGGSDGRHILKTLSRRKRHSTRKLNFYIIENNLEVVARQMMLFGVLLEPASKLGYQEKVQLFLDILGNSHVRQQTAEYFQMKSTELIKLVTNESLLEKHFPLINLSSLKFKERDQMEAIFKFWRNPENGTFDIKKCWEARLTQHLGVRYDNRKNIYDWDYNMKLKDKASIINFHEYASWRESGIAFELREDSAYNFPNRTLASGLIMKKEGERIARRGYWGDIINSPYLAFGIESEEDSLFKKSNEAHTKRATDVSEYNVTAMLHELVTGKCYKPAATQPRLQEVDEAEELIASDEKEISKTATQENSVIEDKPGTIDIDGARVFFLSLNSVTDLPRKSKYKAKFDLVYFSNSMVHHLTESVKEIVHEDAKLILETTKFMLDIKKEISQEFAAKICGLAHSVGFKEPMPCDPERDAFVKFNKMAS